MIVETKELMRKLWSKEYKFLLNTGDFQKIIKPFNNNMLMNNKNKFDESFL